jgi:hypothetical protein
MLKHQLDKHEENPSEMKFQIKAVNYPRSAFERQILESVMLQSSRSHSLVKSKAEFNRSALPRLGLKMGDQELKMKEKENEEEIKREEILDMKSKNLRKQRNKERATARLKRQPPRKRQKILKEKKGEERRR